MTFVQTWAVILGVFLLLLAVAAICGALVDRLNDWLMEKKMRQLEPEWLQVEAEQQRAHAKAVWGRR